MVLTRTGLNCMMQAFTGLGTNSANSRAGWCKNNFDPVRHHFYSVLPVSEIITCPFNYQPLNLYYTDTGGNATALVFLHYFGGSGLTWQPVIKKLQNDYRCIAIDMRGFGQSPSKDTEPSVSDNRDDVLDVLTELQLRRFVLVGHSMGGKIAMAIAATQPPGLYGLVLFAPSPPSAEPMGSDDRDELMEAWGNRQNIETHINSIIAAPLAVPEFEQTVADNLKASATAWLGWLHKGSLEDITDEIQTIKLPVTVVSGSKDNGLTTDYLRTEFSRYFPKLDFIEIENSGHLLPLEKPDEVAAVIRDKMIGYTV